MPLSLCLALLQEVWLTGSHRAAGGILLGELELDTRLLSFSAHTLPSWREHCVPQIAEEQNTEKGPARALVQATAKASVLTLSWH